MAAPLLHVLGAGPWQVGTIRRAKSMGLRVLVSDCHADRPGYELADQHEMVDITHCNATVTVAKRHGADGVLCDTTDTGVYTAAYVADRLGLSGIGLDAARHCTDKAAMTGRLLGAGLRVPRSREAATAHECATAARDLGFPVVVKPVDSQGGRGVGVVADGEGLTDAFVTAMASSRSGRAVIQEFVRGTEMIVDSIVVERRVYRLGLAIKVQFDDNPTISQRITYGVRDLPVPPGAIDAVNEAVIEALGIRQGLVHAEYLVDGDGIVPIDVAARGGAVMIYPTVLPHVSGVDAMTSAIQLALGQRVAPMPMARPRAANIEFLRAPRGQITAIDGIETARSMRGVAAVHLFHGPGDVVQALRAKEDRLGFVIGLADSADQAVALSQRAASAIRTTVAPVQASTFE